MHQHGFQFGLISGQRSHGGQALSVLVPSQVCGRNILDPGQSLEIPVNGRPMTLLAIASRNGIPDAEATLLVDGEVVADLNRGPFPWYEFGHVAATALDAGANVETVTIRNDNDVESCQVEYVIGFTPSENDQPVAAAEVAEPVTA